jgi:hypothetical protein
MAAICPLRPTRTQRAVIYVRFQARNGPTGSAGALRCLRPAAASAQERVQHVACRHLDAVAHPGAAFAEVARVQLDLVALTEVDADDGYPFSPAPGAGATDSWSLADFPRRNS